MGTSLATRQIRIQQWAAIIKDRTSSGLKVDDYCELHILTSKIFTVTVYRFDKNGKGELILPNSNFAFTYEIKDDTLTIDFESENAADSTYTFSVTDDKLTLTAESSDAVYVLTKKTEP